MVSLDDWRGFEEVQRCLTACASPRRGKALADIDLPFLTGPRRGPTFPGLVRQPPSCWPRRKNASLHVGDDRLCAQAEIHRTREHKRGQDCSNPAGSRWTSSKPCIESGMLSCDTAHIHASPRFLRLAARKLSWLFPLKFRCPKLPLARVLRLGNFSAN